MKDINIKYINQKMSGSYLMYFDRKMITIFDIMAQLL